MDLAKRIAIEVVEVAMSKVSVLVDYILLKKARKMVGRVLYLEIVDWILENLE